MRDLQITTCRYACESLTPDPLPEGEGERRLYALKSNRSSSITLLQALTKSFTNAVWLSAAA